MAGVLFRDVLQTTRGHVRLADDRRLEYVVAGPDRGMPLVFSTGSPAAGELYPPLIADASSHGLRTVTYSRPGFGTSSPQPGRRMSDAAADVAALLDVLDAERFVTIGWSGGGPPALACATILGDRCAALACVSSPAPPDADGLDWFAGMNDGNTAEYSAAAKGAELLHPLLEGQAQDMAKMQPADVAPALSARADLDQADVVAFREFLAISFRRAVETGIQGWLEDDLAVVSRWGFDVARVRCPSSIWHGRKDTDVPPSHASWLGAHIPDARTHLLDETHGPVLVAAHRQIVNDLVSIAG